jgi:putative transcriptional regulator
MEGWQIRELRKDLKLTQADLARRLKVHFSTVNRWENDKAKPLALAMDKLNSIAAKGGLNLDHYRKLTHKRRWVK